MSTRTTRISLAACLAGAVAPWLLGGTAFAASIAADGADRRQRLMHVQMRLRAENAHLDACTRHQPSTSRRCPPHLRNVRYLLSGAKIAGHALYYQWRSSPEAARANG